MTAGTIAPDGSNIIPLKFQELDLKARIVEMIEILLSKVQLSIEQASRQKFCGAVHCVNLNKYCKDFSPTSGKKISCFWQVFWGIIVSAEFVSNYCSRYKSI